MTTTLKCLRCGRDGHLPADCKVPVLPDDRMLTATASTHDVQAVSLETLQQAMREIDQLPTNKDWVLIDPDGNCWKTDDIAKLMSILAPHHPLLKMPVFPHFSGGI